MKLDRKEAMKDAQKVRDLLAEIETFDLVNALCRRGWQLSTRTRNSKVRPVLYGPPTE